MDLLCKKPIYLNWFFDRLWIENQCFNKSNHEFRRNPIKATFICILLDIKHVFEAVSVASSMILSFFLLSFSSFDHRLPLDVVGDGLQGVVGVGVILLQLMRQRCVTIHYVE